MNLSRYLLPMAALAMMTGYAAAQMPAPSAPAAKPAATAPAPTAPSGKKAMTSSPDRTAKSKACSDQADQKGLHGKARKKFRDACKKA